MSTPQLRKRTKQTATERDPKPSKKTTASSKTGSSSRWLLPSAILAVGLVSYLYSSTILTGINSWIGTSEWESDPAFNSDHIVDFTADVSKRDAVVAAFKHAWLAYERDAMGDDEYHPISRKGSNLTSAGGIGYTVVDSIDTMKLMGLEAEYTRARDWVANKLSFDRDADFSTFETTIRVLGGLLSAYHLSKEDVFLERATELGDRLLSAFNTPSGLPLSQVNLYRKVGVPDKGLPHLVSTAEVSTLQLELKYLSHLTGNDVYWEKAENVMSVIRSARLPHGLVSIYMSVETGQFVPSDIRLGSRGDSHYEYLNKQYLQTNRTESVYDEMYKSAMQGIHDYLIQKSAANQMTYTAELIPEQTHQGQITWRLVPKQDHLVCFLGGSLMLGATTSNYGRTTDNVSIPPSKDQLTEIGNRDWKSGVELIKTCMYTHDTATGLSPEIVHFRIPSDNVQSSEVEVPQDWYIKGARAGAPPPYDARYMLRPETVESLFVAFRLTGDVRYREQGWKIFQAIEKHCRVETGGYATVINVDEVPSRLEDKMETFLMSETLKYLFLLFEDASVLPLTDYVFNTEAHPLPVFEPRIPTGFS